MLKNFFSTAGYGAWMCLLAVFLTTGTVAATDSSLTQLEDRINDLIYRVSRSVVTVEAIEARPSGTSAAPGRQSVHTLVSSGLIYDSLGHIIVAAGAVVDREHFVVRFDNQTLDAFLSGVDYRTGLALLSVERPIGDPVSFGSCPQCAGQMIVAVGNAFGVRASPSLGFCAGMRADGTMQFSAPITSGTVGGGIFDLAGRLVGVITGGMDPKLRGEIGLAVPASDIPESMAHLIRYGDRPAGYIGIRVADFEVSPGFEVHYPSALVSEGRTPGRIIDRGIMITGVSPGSPAAAAGLATGDLLFSINGVAVSSSAELRRQVRTISPGAGVDIGYIRHDLPYVVQFKTGRLPEPHLDDLTGADLNAPSEIDALRLEVEFLRQTVQSLEQRLR